MAASGVRSSVQAKLQENLMEFGSLTKQLIEVVTGSGKSGPDMQATLEVVEKLVTRDKSIQELATAAAEMCSYQQEVACVEEELERRRQEVCQLQAKLQEAERVIELAVYKGKQKLEAIERAEKGAVSPEDLIQYAHRISQACSVVSPAGWQPNDCRRPFPQDIEMRCGFLGQLTSGVTPNSAGVGGDMSDTGRGPRDDLPPPEKKMALNVHAGMNQNTNNHQDTRCRLSLEVETTAKPPQVLPEPEIMSEDSSPSSDEGT